jgi:hypothetical protein
MGGMTSPAVLSPVAHVELAGGKGYALVDDADIELVAPYSWYRHSNGHGGFYARAYLPGSGRGAPHGYMHQLLAGRGADHENGDGLDNRRANLRVATGSQNMANQGSRGGTSQYKGVGWHRGAGKWIARITVNYQGRHLGLFADEEAAARAYDAAAFEAWGEYARLNFPQEGR